MTTVDRSQSPTKRMIDYLLPSIYSISCLFAFAALMLQGYSFSYATGNIAVFCDYKANQGRLDNSFAFFWYQFIQKGGFLSLSLGLLLGTMPSLISSLKKTAQWSDSRSLFFRHLTIHQLIYATFFFACNIVLMRFPLGRTWSNFWFAAIFNPISPTMKGPPSIAWAYYVLAAVILFTGWRALRFVFPWGWVGFAMALVNLVFATYLPRYLGRTYLCDILADEYSVLITILHVTFLVSPIACTWIAIRRRKISSSDSLSDK